MTNKPSRSEKPSLKQIEQWLAEGAIGGGLNTVAIKALLKEIVRLKKLISDTYDAQNG